MDDTISRQAALDALDKRFDDVPMELTTEILQLRRDLRERIPSAQPATNCSEIPNGSDDTISRQAALDALRYAELGCELEAIEALPSAQQWIPWNSGRYPDESRWYIVTAYDGNTSRVTFAKYQTRLKRWELTGARAYWRVLAWCELPEPWKGDTP